LLKKSPWVSKLIWKLLMNLFFQAVL
jgi:hypothetical protein